jgi:rsbT co-antagonist protein RsbR
MEVQTAGQQQSRIGNILKKNEAAILNDWLRVQLSAPTMRRDLIKEGELRDSSAQILRSFSSATQSGSMDVNSAAWAPVRDVLAQVSNARARQGFTPSETTMFVFSLKEPLFTVLRNEYGSDTQRLFEEIWTATNLVDRLGLLTMENFQKAREATIARQQEELLELSTPVVKLWDGILALPLIGTLDSARTQIVMESLLQKIVETGSLVAIIDITGVPTVDTLVAQHLIKTITAARLMGADCIVSGIRPQIAQTIVHLGVGLADVVTKANLADAFALALQRTGMGIRAVQPKKKSSDFEQER